MASVQGSNKRSGCPQCGTEGGSPLFTGWACVKPGCSWYAPGEEELEDTGVHKRPRLTRAATPHKYAVIFSTDPSGYTHTLTAEQSSPGLLKKGDTVILSLGKAYLANNGDWTVDDTL